MTEMTETLFDTVDFEYPSCGGTIITKKGSRIKMIHECNIQGRITGRTISFEWREEMKSWSLDDFHEYDYQGIPDLHVINKGFRVN